MPTRLAEKSAAVAKRGKMDEVVRLSSSDRSLGGAFRTDGANPVFAIRGLCEASGPKNGVCFVEDALLGNTPDTPGELAGDEIDGGDNSGSRVTIRLALPGVGVPDHT